MTSSSTPTTLPVELAARIRSPRIAQTIGYCLAFVALGLFSASLGPTLPGLARHTQAHLNQISYLFTARALGYLLGSFGGGRLYDRVAGHAVMAGVLVVMAVMMALVPVIPLLWLLAAAMLVLGMGEGTLDVGGNTLLVWAHREKVGPFMSALHFFFGFGAFLSPIVIAQAVLLSGDIQWAYWALAVLMVPAFVWLLRAPSPPAPTASEGSPTGQARLLLVALFALFFFLFVAAESSFGGWIYTYAVARGLGSTAVAAYLTSAFWGSLTLGRLLSIPLAARFNPSAVLLGDLVGCLVGMIGILLGANSVAALWLGTFVVGFSIASLFPTTISLAGSRMRITGRVTGWFMVGASAGGMTLPWLIGQLFEPVGPQVAMLLILADLVAALGVYAILALDAR